MRSDLARYYSDNDLNHTWWLLRTMSKDRSLIELISTLLVMHPSMCADHAATVIDRAEYHILRIIQKDHVLMPKLTIL